MLVETFGELGLLGFVVLFVPGFISVKVYDLLVPTGRRNFSESVYEVVSYSVLHFAGLSWAIVLLYGYRGALSAVSIAACAFAMLFIIPCMWPILILRLRTRKWIARHTIHPVEKPWDYFFLTHRQPVWVIVHLKDGRKIGGRFDQQSHASSSPADEQIYLEEVWTLDECGAFGKLVERSKGIVILRDEILAVEFFQDEPEPGKGN